MEIYIKKIVELSEEEKKTLRAAASIMDWLAEETDESDFYRASEDIMWAVENSPFTTETRE